MIEFLIGAAVAAVVVVVGFVWLNRNQASRLDEMEEKVRSFKKK